MEATDRGPAYKPQFNLELRNIKFIGWLSCCRSQEPPSLAASSATTEVQVDFEVYGTVNPKPKTPSIKLRAYRACRAWGPDPKP